MTWSPRNRCGEDDDDDDIVDDGTSSNPANNTSRCSTPTVVDADAVNQRSITEPSAGAAANSEVKQISHSSTHASDREGLLDEYNTVHKKNLIGSEQVDKQENSDDGFTERPGSARDKSFGQTGERIQHQVIPLFVGFSTPTEWLSNSAKYTRHPRLLHLSYFSCPLVLCFFVLCVTWEIGNNDAKTTTLDVSKTKYFVRQREFTENLFWRWEQLFAKCPTWFGSCYVVSEMKVERLVSFALFRPNKTFSKIEELWQIIWFPLQVTGVIVQTQNTLRHSTFGWRLTLSLRHMLGEHRKPFWVNVAFLTNDEMLRIDWKQKNILYVAPKRHSYFNIQKYIADKIWLK